MIFTRVFLVALALLLMVGCGRDKKEQQRQRQQQAAQTQTQVEPSRTADALFDEFFDASAPRAQTAPAPAAAIAPARRETAPVSREVRFSPNGRFVVQVSTIASPSLAGELVRKLERQGFPAYSVAVENPATNLLGTYYRVRIGGFDNISDAKHFGESTLRPLGYDFWVDNRSNDRIGIGGAGLGTFQPQPQHRAVAYDELPPAPIPTPTPTPAPDPIPVPVVEEQWGTITPVEPAPVSAGQIQPVPTDDNSWDNFEW